MLMAKSMKKMLRQTFSVFEPEKCLEMESYKYSFDQNFMIVCHMELVFFCFFLFCVGTSC